MDKPLQVPKILLFASTNLGKLKEVREVARSFGISVISPGEVLTDYKSFGLSEQPGPPPIVEENGATYEENAKLKADAFFQWSGMPSLADDTGLEVKALAGAPGLISARYAGEPSNAARNIEKLLKELAPHTDRSAHFYCLLYLKLSKDEFVIAEGQIDGEIAHAPQGRGGFGYDPIFVVRNLKASLAELKERSTFFKTHRVLALESLFEPEAAA